jgi:hypothetical protein
MHSRRQIFFSPACDIAASKLGGYEQIDESLTSGVYDALLRHPYGFSKIECDWFSARYITTKPFGTTPALVWIFTIEANGDVVIDNVEIYENYR